mmetsp:Transcript_25502/g.48231  ORF Transcript_25502/g.48231 Transcript_25502/m.48231 type:complete len:234 (-) Transcript_25502:107-808(-)
MPFVLGRAWPKYELAIGSGMYLNLFTIVGCLRPLFENACHMRPNPVCTMCTVLFTMPVASCRAQKDVLSIFVYPSTPRGSSSRSPSLNVQFPLPPFSTCFFTIARYFDTPHSTATGTNNPRPVRNTNIMPFAPTALARLYSSSITVTPCTVLSISSKGLLSLSMRSASTTECLFCSLKGRMSWSRYSSPFLRSLGMNTERGSTLPGHCSSCMVDGRSKSRTWAGTASLGRPNK